MILNNITDETEQIELMEEMNMDVYRDDIQELVYSEYGDELDKKDQEIRKMAQDITEKDKDIAEKDKDLAEKDRQIIEMERGFKEKIEEINAREDIPADTKKIINSILLVQK